MDERASTDNEGETASGHRARLRKRLLDAGPQGFHDYELIEYLLALTIPRVDTKPLAKGCFTISAESDPCSRPAPTPCAVRALQTRRSRP
jgi:DNA repair protein RadC